MKKIYVIILLLYNSITLNAQQDQNISINFNQTISYISEKWKLTDIQPLQYSSLFNHYIAKAYSAIYNQEVIVKISESNNECYGLQCLQGNGIVNLLDYDHQHFALLLQYIPSKGCLVDYITTYDDDWIIDVFIDLFKKIHGSEKKITTHTFQHIHDHFSILHAYSYSKIPEHFLQKALQIYNQIIITDDSQYLLHGDLHFRNILRYQDHFIAIDPWTTIGPLEYEVASFLSSPTDFLLLNHNVEILLQNRLDRLSDVLNLDRQKLKDYSFLRVIFLACLCEMKHKNYDWIDEFIKVAQIIDQLQV